MLQQIFYLPKIYVPAQKLCKKDLIIQMQGKIFMVCMRSCNKKAEPDDSAWILASQYCRYSLRRQPFQ
jgi:hypothetical protein